MKIYSISLLLLVFLCVKPMDNEYFDDDTSSTSSIMYNQVEQNDMQDFQCRFGCGTYLSSVDDEFEHCADEHNTIICTDLALDLPK